MKNDIDVKELGLINNKNGVDVEQTCEYIHLHNTAYINKLLEQHKWLAQNTTPMHQFPLPMDLDNRYLHELEHVEPLNQEDKQLLESKLKFKYCQAIGEIIYVMITCYPNISYAIINCHNIPTIWLSSTSKPSFICMGTSRQQKRKAFTINKRV